MNQPGSSLRRHSLTYAAWWVDERLEAAVCEQVVAGANRLVVINTNASDTVDQDS